MEYSIIFKNNSTNKGRACVYQTVPNNLQHNIMSLAWFSKAAYPDTQIKFSWKIDYSFVWGEVGELIPGVLFEASQVLPADLRNTNVVTLDYDEAYHFVNQTYASRKAQLGNGSLHIKQQRDIPLKKAAVGIGMSGSGTFVVQAEPNVDVAFTPHPEYWITFGSFVQGQVLDIQQMSLNQNIKFPPNVYTMEATLNKNNTWTIKAR